MNEYYVYIYLDPRKEGNFIYDKYVFDHEPFYVGKGKGSRYLRHLKTNEWNPLKNNKISKILKDGLNPIISKIEINLSNEESIGIEKELIRKIGKISTKTGPLTNISDGGESYTGYKHKQEYINKLQRPVVKYDIEGVILEEYSSVKEASEKNGTHQQTISNICTGSIKIWKNKFIFLYKGDSFETRTRLKKEYPVLRIDYKNDIREYPSISCASNECDILQSKINQVCMGERFQTGGYIWRYKKHPKMTSFNKKIDDKYHQYLDLLDKKIVSDKCVIYENILHIISSVKNAKVNNIYNLIMSKKIYKIDES